MSPLLGSTDRAGREMQAQYPDKLCRSPDRDKDFPGAAVDPAGADSAEEAVVLAAEAAAAEASSVAGRAADPAGGLRESRG
jgi:hypothetical protein